MRFEVDLQWLDFGITTGIGTKRTVCPFLFLKYLKNPA